MVSGEQVYPPHIVTMLCVYRIRRLCTLNAENTYV